MKKSIVLLAVLALCFTGPAFASSYKGKVVKVEGKMVTIKITKGKAADLKKGTKIKFEAGKPKKKGGAALQGC